ncbi:SET domain-containing protein 5 [Lachnellula arida]|uniref:SET domain-containing protein 5 n=1 Tax=Lachnellula arida TaxID=1316785 RepID=A0A8T9BFQ9_9HELO|nr:SET domain-containing protein 5 [Lachnellula arida]
MPQLHRRVLAVWVANCFGDVFLLGSRINHSCAPNVHFAYNSALGKQTFHAIRDIEAGEELAIMYINGTNRTRGQRQDELKKWGFRCNCPICEDTSRGRKKEEKRVELFRLDQELATYTRFNFQHGPEDSWKKALKAAQRMAGLQKSEGLLNRDLSISYHDAARYSARLGDASMALLWAEKELEVDRYCVGVDHPHYSSESDTVRQLREAVESSLPFDQSSIKWFDSCDSPSNDNEACAVM